MNANEKKKGRGQFKNDFSSTVYVFFKALEGKLGPIFIIFYFASVEHV